MNKITIFNNPQFGEIRTTIGENGEPIFCLADVAKALGYSRPADAVSTHCKGVVILPTPTNGGIQQIKFGKEGDVYRLVMKSKLPEASIFQDWVCDEVLPSIRKTGGYLVTKSDDTPEMIMARAVLVAQATIERQRKQISEQCAKIEADAPKVEFADAITASSSTCLIGELAKVLTQNGYEIGQNRLFKVLRNEGYLGKYGEYYNIPIQKYVEMGLFQIKKGTRTGRNGEVYTVTTTKVTGKGLQYFINKFLAKKNNRHK